jgi:predicted O-methyltransferase YrrM
MDMNNGKLTNSGGITDMDGDILIEGINEVKPDVYLEIGTGIGSSTDVIFNYLIEEFPNCEFYTIDINPDTIREVIEKYNSYSNFNAILGLSVKKNELVSRAKKKCGRYRGTEDVLRKVLLNMAEVNKKVDVCFIDSIRGSALSEFKIIINYLKENGIIFCHDILNGGKGVEIKEYLDVNKDKFEYEIIDTGTTTTSEKQVKPGMMRIRLK